MVEKFTIEIARDGSITVTPPPKPRHTAEDFRAVIQKELGLSRTSPCRLHAHDSIAPKYSPAVANPTHRMSHGRVQLRVACQKRDRGPQSGRPG